VLFTNVNAETCRDAAKFYRFRYQESNLLGNGITRADWTGSAFKEGDEVILCQMEGPWPSEDYSNCVIESLLDFPSTFACNPIKLGAYQEYRADVAEVCAAFE